ncbi:MAG: cupredoxin domain-containing protein [Acidobacteriota bacterium]
MVIALSGGRIPLEVRHRHMPEAQLIAGHLRTLAVTGLLLAAGLGPAFPAEQDPAPIVVDVTATRFAFAPDRIEVTEGNRVVLNVHSGDATHGFKIKELHIKKEVPRGGDVVSIVFTAPAAGSYDITCSEYCGRGHDNMHGVLVVKPRG